MDFKRALTAAGSRVEESEDKGTTEVVEEEIDDDVASFHSDEPDPEEIEFQEEDEYIKYAERVHELYGLIKEYEGYPIGDKMSYYDLQEFFDLLLMDDERGRGVEGE